MVINYPIHQNIDIQYLLKIKEELSSFVDVKINKDGSLTKQMIMNDYFLVNDKWNLDFIGSINNFKNQYANYKGKYKNLSFIFPNPSINLEIKYVIYHRLFNGELTLSGLFNDYQKKLRRLGEFLSEKYANISSLLHLDIENAKEEWFDWLRYRGFKTHRLSYNAARGKTYKCMTSLASTLNVIYTNLFHLTDTREEWEKDIWDVRVLNEKYNIDYNKSKTVYTLNFTTIKNKIIREQVKKYFKQRLLSKRNFSWSTATNYLYYIPRFINLILFLEPKWKDFQDLSREHIEKYIENLNNYAKTQIKQGKSHPEHYISKGINIIQKFLEDLQTFEYSIACQKNIRLLILPSDKPKLKKRPYDHIDYIPDTVLEQLFRDINHLHRDAQPIL